MKQLGIGRRVEKAPQRADAALCEAARHIEARPPSGNVTRACPAKGLRSRRATSSRGDRSSVRMCGPRAALFAAPVIFR